MLDETLSRETDFCDNDNHPTLFPLLRVYSYIASAVRGHWTQGVGVPANALTDDANNLLLDNADNQLLDDS